MNADTKRTEYIASLDAETRLLLRCFESNQSFQPDDFAYIDTGKFLRILDNHRLSTSVYSRVKNNHSFSPVINHQLRDRYVNSKLRMLTYMAELCRVMKLLQLNNIHAVALKGPMIGHRYYNDYTQRACNDLDILVKPGDVQRAYQLLHEADYNLSEVLWHTPKQEILYRKTFHHYGLYNSTNDVQLELHWKLNTPVDDTLKIMGNVWSNLTIEKVGGLAIPVLSRRDTFIYLCIHGGVHQWKRLFWVQDIAQMIDKEGEKFILDTYQYVGRKSTGKYILEGCYL